MSVPVGFTFRAIWPKVNIEADYNYQCDVKWLTNLSQEVVKEELSTGASYSIQDIDNAIRNKGLLQSE